MQANISRGQIGWFVYFIGELSDLFLDKLQDDDPPALLIIAYLCALFSQIYQWWICNSARVEGQRLCGILDGLHDPSL